MWIHHPDINNGCGASSHFRSAQQSTAGRSADAALYGYLSFGSLRLCWLGLLSCAKRKPHESSKINHNFS